MWIAGHQPSGLMQSPRNNPEGGGAAYAMWSEIEHFNMRANEQD
jgi:hypothetical protein